MKTAMLMGDSITGGLTDWGRRGYARLVQDGLASEWVIKTLPENGGDSRQLRSNLDHWLGASTSMSSTSIVASTTFDDHLGP